MGESFRTRPASPADLAGLVSLERASFSDPWSSTQLADALAQPTCLALVAEGKDGVVVGDLLGRVVADEAEILTLAVHPDCRRQGIGQLLLDRALEALLQRGVRSVWLEVRQSNEGARALYTRAGFIATGLRRGYYRRPVEDALVLKRELSTNA
jgi:[ribosomal protein S18]-alanine N-acetyltransferase